MKGVASLSLALAIAAPPCFARTNEGQETPPGVIEQQRQEKTEEASTVLQLPSYQFLSNPRPPVAIPLTVGAWVLVVERFGGLTGNRKDHIVITSDGDVTVDTLEVARSLKLPMEVAQIDRIIGQARPSEWSKSNKANVEPGSLCQECYKTNLTLYRRDRNNRESGYRAYWDATTITGLINEVRQILKEAERIKERALYSLKIRKSG
ncbi:MAG: hypothetical protein WAV47_22395 [Blastocatellia bacterium]